MNFFPTKTLYLASQSPRRKQLLEGLDVSFEVLVIDYDEQYPAEMVPGQVPAYLAEQKARVALKYMLADGIVITADSLVIKDDRILSKPETRAEAIAFINDLSGAEHEVITGVCIKSSEKTVSFDCKTVVRFGNIHKEEIEYYIDKYAPYDKAGGYGIQEWIGHCKVEEIRGSYNNVMGLPTHLVYKHLIEF